MARLNQMPEPMRSHLAELPCPSFEAKPWVTGPPLSRRRVSLISTAGLQRRGDRPFEGMTGDYRVIPGHIQARDLVMSHISTNFDRTGVVEFEPLSASEFLGAFGTDGQPVTPKADISLATALRLAAQDLKAFYFEAVIARPGSTPPSSREFQQWFWQETAAARILKAVQEKCLKSEDKSLKMTGAVFLIPMDQR